MALLKWTFTCHPKTAYTENQDRIVRVAELQRKLISKLQQAFRIIFHAAITTEWAPETWDGDIGMDVLETFGIP